MKTHNLVIHHCLACGAIMHSEPDQETPQCCGRPMVKAAAETVGTGEGQLPTEPGQPPADAHPPVDRISQKPR